MSKITKNKTTSGVWKANKMFSKLRIYMQFVHTERTLLRRRLNKLSFWFNVVVISFYDAIST